MRDAEGFFGVELAAYTPSALQGNPCAANPALCLSLTSLTPSAISPAISRTWLVFYPSASPVSAFPQPGAYVGIGNVTSTPVIPAGYQLTVSAIFYDTPAGSCVIGNSSYRQMWHVPGTAPTATLPYGTSTNLGYNYVRGGESLDKGCGWCGHFEAPPGLCMFPYPPAL